LISHGGKKTATLGDSLLNIAKSPRFTLVANRWLETVRAKNQKSRFSGCLAKNGGVSCILLENLAARPAILKYQGGSTLMTTNNLRYIFAAAAAILCCHLSAIAAPIILQDYEPPGNLDAPFNLAPDFSGTTVGVVAATDTTTHVATDGAVGTTASAELFLEHDTVEAPPTAGWKWQVRLLPNNGGSTNAQNPLFNADGYVGYWLKVDPAVTATIRTAPVLEGSTGTTTASAGDLQTVIKDGQWHLYQWNMDDPSQFDNTFNDVYAGGLGDTVLESQVSFDSIAVVSPDGGNATFRIDQIGYDNAGPLPEPTTAVLAALGLATSLVVRRRVK
jgi:hypothetical protein